MIKQTTLPVTPEGYNETLLNNLIREYRALGFDEAEAREQARRDYPEEKSERLHHPDEVTPQIVDEEDIVRIRPSHTNPAPASEVDQDHIEPDKMDIEEWDAGADEWMREGHDDLIKIPLDRPGWEALLRRRAARLKKEKVEREKVRRENRRQEQINRLKPPQLDDAIVNAKAINEAQAAYEKGKEDLSEAWDTEYRTLPSVIQEAWNIYHQDFDDGYWGFRIRTCTPAPEDFPDDLTGIERALADPIYRKFRRYSTAVLQQIEELEANVERLLNPPPNSRPPLKGWSLEEIDEKSRLVVARAGSHPARPHSSACRRVANRCGCKSSAHALRAVCRSTRSSNCSTGECCTLPGTLALHVRR